MKRRISTRSSKTLARMDKGSASGSASEASTRATKNPQDDFIFQQRAQHEQLKQLFLLVSSLGSKIEAVAIVVAEGNSNNRRVEPSESSPSYQEKEKAAACNVSFANEVDEKKGEIDDDADRGIDSGDDYISHGLYRDIIAEGFDKRSPSRLASNKPAYFPIDDPVTRTLTASKYSTKVHEYSITVANAFFASVIRVRSARRYHLCRSRRIRAVRPHLPRPGKQQHGGDRRHASRPDALTRPHLRSQLLGNGMRLRKQRP